MKQFILLITSVMMFCSFTLNETQPDEKVQEEFNNRFANATNIIWSVNNKQSEANFTINGIRSRAVYNNRAKLIFSILPCESQTLPYNVTSVLEEKFHEYKMKYAKEVTVRNLHIFYLTLFSEKNMVTLVLDADGEIIKKDIYLRADNTGCSYN